MACVLTTGFADECDDSAGGVKKDSVLKGKRLAWHKNLKKDIYMNEALNVLSELKMKKEYSIVKH